MFSGIVERTGTVRAIQRAARDMVLTIATALPDLDLGESIAVDGVCLTVASFTADGDADFHLSAETLDRTALGRLVAGARVNLERASTPATRLSGHIVQGHVDGVGQVVAITRTGESRHLVVALPVALRRYVVEKGSIALDGISLTVNALDAAHGDTFAIHLMIIPHTWTHTGLSGIAAGDRVNVEVDVLAKYVESLLAHGRAS